VPRFSDWSYIPSRPGEWLSEGRPASTIRPVFLQRLNELMLAVCGRPGPKIWRRMA